MRSNIIITSVISPIDLPLNYTPIRSVFSEQVRLQQTVETIVSVKNAFPKCRVILADCSKTSYHVDIKELQNVMTGDDIFVDLSKDPEVCKWVHSSNKSAGECFILKSALSNIDVQGDVYKISGRYTVESSFDLNVFDTTKQFNLRVLLNTPWEGSTSITALYRVIDKQRYMDFLLFAANRYSDGENTSMEKMLYNFVNTLEPASYQLFHTPLGVKGRIAVNGIEEVN